jgi:cyanate permease
MIAWYTRNFIMSIVTSFTLYFITMAILEGLCYSTAIPFAKENTWLGEDFVWYLTQKP